MSAFSAKRKCKFNDVLANQYPFIIKAKSGCDSDVICTICSSSFSVANGGKSHIESHISTTKHKRARLTLSNTSRLDLICNFNGISKKESEVASAEGVFAYHTAKHCFSLRSMDCLSKILKKVFDSSFGSARTKTQAIIENVLVKYAKDELFAELEKSSFISVYTDSTNHKGIKVFPLLVRYFSPKNGTQVKLLELENQRCETAEVISDYVMQVLKNHELLEKVIGFCADNTNTNFGGSNRRGINNVFAKLQDSLSHKLVGVGCSAHILNNTIHTAANILPIDIESVLNKIYSFFHIYTVRVEALKDYCNYVSSGTEYQQVLGYSNTRWLSLLPAIERLINMFEPLKEYFLSERKCPVILKHFFEDKSAMVWLIFLQLQAKIFFQAIQQVEGQLITIIDVSNILYDISKKFEARLSDEFIPISIRKFLDEGDLDSKMIKDNIMMFYDTCIEYLKKWAAPFAEFSKFSWINLQKGIKWEDIEKCFSFIQEMHSKTIDDSQLYDEFTNVKEYCNDKKITYWNGEKFPTDKRWAEIFCHFKQHNVPHENMKSVIEMILCLPGTNAPTERVFSSMNRLWTSEKNTIDMSMLKALLIVKTNLNFSCCEFYEMLKKNEKMLKMIRSSEKYLS